jgi:hypothetical protein
MRRIRRIFLLSLDAPSIAALLGCMPSTDSDSPAAPDGSSAGKAWASGNYLGALGSHRQWIS